ncbi:MAG: DMT family transporter [Propionicimonas sp.]
MMGVILALASSVMWGSSDFAAGLASRRADVLRVTAIAYVAASAVAMLWLVVFPGQWSAQAVWAGIFGGVFTVVGFLAFYLSLVRGAMGVATAIVGASESVVPVVAAVLWREQSLSALAWVGVVAAVLGAILVGLAEPGGSKRSAWWSVGLSISAGVSFGLAVVALDAAPKDSGMVAPAVEMFVGLVVMPLLVAMVVVMPRMRRVGERVGLVTDTPMSAGSRWIAVAAGACFGAANLVLMLAILAGPLAAVGVVVSLYPVTTILLARILLKEKLVKLQVAGIVAALTGCVLLGVG